MYRQTWYSLLCVAVLGLAWAGTAQAADPNLVGWWEFESDADGVAVDSSGNGLDGVIAEGAMVMADPDRGNVLYVDGATGYASIPDGNAFDVDDLTICFWMKLTSDFDAASGQSIAPVGKVLDGGHNLEFTLIGADNSQGPKGAMYFKPESGGYCYANTVNTYWAANTWYHITGVHNSATSTGYIYVNGELSSSVSMTRGAFVFRAIDAPLEIGRCVIEKAGNTMKYFEGYVDDVRLYSRVLDAQEVQDIVQGVLPVVAERPGPADNASDVPRDGVVLTWTPGAHAAQHDVYLGTDPDAVRDATTASETYLGRQADDACALGRLALGQTYYWRVDEINNGYPGSPWVGAVWSFTVEPTAIPIPRSLITATASSRDTEATGAGKTIDGTGLAGGVQTPEDMWLSGEDPNGAWIQYMFDKPYKLHAVQVWNQNSESEKYLGFGIKEALISYSADGQTWVELGTEELAQGVMTPVDLYDVTAIGVRITALSNWGGLFEKYGLSEVQFEYIPTYARRPEPAQGDGAPPDAVLSWRSGREAAVHNLYLGTDPNELPLIDATTGSSYDGGLLGLQLGGTYYWRIDEVNDAETPSVWPGEVWSFSTPEYLPVDDFESYTDDYENYNRIFQVWIDGAGYTAPDPGHGGNGSGALVGTNEAPWVERAVVHSGGKSMPLGYDNTAVSWSQADRTFAEPQDWTRGGITTLVLYFCGDPANQGGQLYVKINGVKIPYDGDPAGIGWAWWSQWNIDLASSGVTDLENVTSLSVGVEGAGATGILYVDDIRLYKNAPPCERVVQWLEAEAGSPMSEPMRAWSDMAGASGGQYIAVPGNLAIERNGPAAAGRAGYTLTLPAGTYKIYGRVVAPGGTQDSFYVQMQGADLNVKTHSSGWLHWILANGSAWHWVAVNSYDEGKGKTPALFTVPGGTYTLEIAYREPGALLDALVITEPME